MIATDATPNAVDDPPPGGPGRAAPAGPPAAVPRPAGTGRAAALVRDVILGGQDGLVNVLGLVLGMAVATGDSRVVITAGLAAMLAESIAMAGVAYTSSGAERGLATRAGRRIQAEAAERHDERRQVVLDSLVAGGASAEIVETVAAVIDHEGQAWEAELRDAQATMAPVRETRPIRAALVVGLSTLLGSAVPLVPFAALPIEVAPIVALLAAVVVLFVAGVERARLSGGVPLRAGLELVGIGVVSALAGYVIGRVLRAPGV
jgi:vacuolar iron transporter family protein